MKINSDTSQFSPQIAALAMPSESGFSKAAEGIGNVGKVFQDQQDREQTAALNTLKMGVAQEELKSKKFDNSIAGEEWDNKKTTYALDRRNKTLEGLKKEIEWKSDVKKQTDNGFMDQFKKVVPSQTFVDPKSGKFSEELYQGARNQFKSAGGWSGENIHLFDALADGYRKESMEADKTKSEIASKEATAKKTALEATMVIPESNAKIFKDNMAGKNYQASAMQTTLETPSKIEVNKSLVQQRRMAAALNAVNAKNAEGSQDTGKPDLSANGKKSRAQDIAMGRMKNIIPGYEGLDQKQKIDTDTLYLERGLKGYARPHQDGDEKDYAGSRMYYPKGSLPTATKTPVKKTATLEQTKGYIKYINK